MIELTSNNWHSWQYGNNDLFGRQLGTDKLNIVLTPSNRPNHSFKEELIIDFLKIIPLENKWYEFDISGLIIKLIKKT